MNGYQIEVSGTGAWKHLNVYDQAGEMIVDKKYVLLANSNFDLTDKILKILDKELKSINLN